MKREDSDAIDLVSKKCKYVEQWKSIPLIYFKNYSKIYDEFIDEIDYNIKLNKGEPKVDLFNRTINQTSKNGLQLLPVNEFIFYINSMKYNKSLIKIKADKENNTLYSELFTLGEIEGNKIASTLPLKCKLELLEKGFGVELMNGEQLIDKVQEEDVEVLMGHTMSAMSCILHTINKIHETNLYPVEKTVNNFKRKFKHGKKKKIGKQRTIIYLSKLPVRYKNSKKLGGHHASPCYHQRIGHMHTMRHEKFKDHPDYMKPIWRKPVWVGIKETIVDGVTYKVL